MIDQTSDRGKGRWLFAALVAGSLIGWADLSATEVQGTLLLLMVAAFIVSLPGRGAAWLLALLVTLGISGTHALAAFAGAGTFATAGESLIALVPAVMAAYAGRWAGRLVAAAAATIPRVQTTPGDAAASALPWYARRSGSRALLSGILLGGAMGGGPAVAFTLTAAGQPNAWWVASIWQVVTLVGWIALMPSVIRVWRARRGVPSPRELVRGGALVAALAAIHVAALLVMTRVLLIPLGASGAFGEWAVAFSIFLPLDLVTVILLGALAHASDVDRHMHELAQRSAVQSAELHASRLAALRTQLQPHFLFNALNAAVVLARRGDAAKAAQVLTDLGDLLRHVLREGPGLVRLEEELVFVERYLAIERMRFPDRLRASVEADRDVRDAFVPALLLQPIVENAVRHGIARRVGAGKLVVRVRREGAMLQIVVEDDGAGLPSHASSEGPSERTDGEVGHGVGLSNTRARLAALYGTAGSITLAPRPGGGAIARLTLPFDRGTLDRVTDPAAPPVAGVGKA